MPAQPDARFVLTLSCADAKGIVAAVAGEIAAQDGNIVESAQYGDPESGRFFMRVAFDVARGTERAEFERRFSAVRDAYGMACRLDDASVLPRVLILVSKLGHCLNDLMYRHSVGQLPMRLVAVASNHQDFRRRVEADDVPFFHLPVTAATRAEQEASLADLIEDRQVDLVVLARYMQVLSDGLAARLSGRAINIHHSFLPSFKGALPYHRAHERGVKLIGATAHYVTAELDEGPIIEQDVEPVSHAMSVEEFVAIGRDIEAQVLARAVRHHLESRVLINGRRTVVFK